MPPQTLSHWSPAIATPTNDYHRDRTPFRKLTADEILKVMEAGRLDLKGDEKRFFEFCCGIEETRLRCLDEIQAGDLCLNDRQIEEALKKVSSLANTLHILLENNAFRHQTSKLIGSERIEISDEHNIPGPNTEPLLGYVMWAAKCQANLKRRSEHNPNDSAPVPMRQGGLMVAMHEFSRLWCFAARTSKLPTGNDSPATEFVRVCLHIFCQVAVDADSLKKDVASLARVTPTGWDESNWLSV